MFFIYPAKYGVVLVSKSYLELVLVVGHSKMALESDYNSLGELHAFYSQLTWCAVSKLKDFLSLAVEVALDRKVLVAQLYRKAIIENIILGCCSPIQVQSNIFRLNLCFILTFSPALHTTFCTRILKSL